jgi:subtilisin family serine protease
MKHLKLLPLAVFLFLIAVSTSFAREIENYNGHNVVAKQAIFQIDLSKFPGQSAVILQQLRGLASADDVRTLNAGVGLYVIHSTNANVTALLNILKNHSAVALAEPDFIVTSVSTPNDPSFPQQWDMYNTATPGADISATLAWNITTGSTANVIGVVDTGFDYTHGDLAANIWSAPAQFTVNLSWGSITCPAGSHGYNALARSCNPADDNQHGTHVSGTIGAAGNNSLGVAGVNWTTRIMGLKFLDSTGSGSVSDAIDAIEFGLQAKTIFGSGANLRVLSNSWGGSGFSGALLTEINNANTADVLFVVAAGNNASSDDTSPTYPASYTAANLVTVAATTNTDALASFSNYGKNTVHLGAPGLSILSTLPGGAYGYLSGTSMATPHVSGAAMLILSKCSLNTAALKNTLLANVDVISSLQNITVSGGRLNVFKALQSCVAVGGPPTGTATFVKTDATTAGSWRSVYGAEGYNIIGNSTSYPSYVTATATYDGQYTFAASTTDPRGAQKAPPATDRIAACYYSSTQFYIDLSFNDANTHQVAVYALDWDGFGGGRRETLDIRDANGTLLDSRAISNFSGGQYLVWNLSGHVVLRVTNTNTASNGLISAILFGGGATTTSSGTVSFVKTDSTTSGSWRGVYGAEGYNIINASSAYPSYVTVSPSSNSSYTFAASTTDPRGTQKPSPATDRIAACWYSSSSFSTDLAFNDSATHQVAVYLLDWDGYGGGRSERVDILDASGTVLDTRSVSSFGNGQYLVWNLSGHVVVRVTNTNSASNALMSAILFGGSGSSTPSTAAFVKTDTTTSGTWRGVYGLDGYNVIGNAASYPAYVTVTPAGNSNYTFVASTTDPRAPQKAPPATDRIAACWYSSTTVSLDVLFSDTNTHQFALYLLDWDQYGGGRTERVDILDGSGNVLDTRSVSNFANGQYLVWNLSGHVVVRITNTNAASNGLMSGLFFR